jgi:hypothetical protein
MRLIFNFFVIVFCIFLCAAICTYLNYCLTIGNLDQIIAQNFSAFLTQTFIGPTLWSKFPSFPDEMKILISAYCFLLVVVPILGLTYIGRRRRWSYRSLGLAGLPIGLIIFLYGVIVMIHYGDGLITCRFAIGFGLGLIAVLYAALCCIVLTAIDLWKTGRPHRTEQMLDFVAPEAAQGT